MLRKKFDLFKETLYVSINKRAIIIQINTACYKKHHNHMLQLQCIFMRSFLQGDPKHILFLQFVCFFIYFRRKTFAGN